MRPRPRLRHSRGVGCKRMKHAQLVLMEANGTIRRAGKHGARRRRRGGGAARRQSQSRRLCGRRAGRRQRQRRSADAHGQRRPRGRGRLRSDARGAGEAPVLSDEHKLKTLLYLTHMDYPSN